MGLVPDAYVLVFSGPGGDLLFRVLRRSTIGAEGFHGRVRDGIGSDRFAEGHQAGETHFEANGVLSFALFRMRSEKCVAVFGTHG